MTITKYFMGLSAGVAVAALLNGCSIVGGQKALDADALAQLQKGKTFYMNVLKAADQHHINGPTTASHGVMAQGAMKTLLKKVALNSFYSHGDHAFKGDVVHLASGEEDRELWDRDVESLTFPGGLTVRQDAPEQPVNSYADQYDYLQNAIWALHEGTGADILTLSCYAATGSLNVRDPHTACLTPAETDELRVQVSGKLGGIGITMKMAGDYIEVIKPTDGGPADKAGLLKGDRIIAVDGEPLQGMAISEAAALVRGDAGTNVVLTIKRGDEEAFDTTLPRAIVADKTAEGRLIGEHGDVVYVKLDHFSQKSAQDIMDVVQKLVDESDKKGTDVGRVFIDLRNNGGGELTGGLMVTDLLAGVNGGDPYPIAAFGKTAADNQVMVNTVAPPIETEAGVFDSIPVPVTILVNGGSASASEIVTGALKGQPDREIVGTRTFGKGTMQETVPLIKSGEVVKGENRGGKVVITDSRGAEVSAKDIQGSLKLTVAFFFAGKAGLSNQGSGVTPDTVVVTNDGRQDATEKTEIGLGHALDVTVPNYANVHPGKQCVLKAEFSGTLDESLQKTVPDYLITEVKMPGADEPVKVLDATLACALQGWGENIPYTVTGPWMPGAP